MAEATSPTTGRRLAWPRSARSGTSRAPPFMPRARRRRAPSRQRRPQRAAGPSPASATRRCSPPSTPTSSDPRGPAKDTGRSGPGCVRSMACGCHANACCGSCASMACCRPIALARAPCAARSADRHRGAECDVGDRRDPNRHRPGRQGLAVRRRRALERRAARLACRQARDPLQALQAVGMAVRNQFDRVDAGAARGLAHRHDHGSNFMSDAFQKQIRSWGIAPSYAFVGVFSIAIFVPRTGDRAAKSRA